MPLRQVLRRVLVEPAHRDDRGLLRLVPGEGDRGVHGVLYPRTLQAVLDVARACGWRRPRWAAASPWRSPLQRRGAAGDRSRSTCRRRSLRRSGRPCVTAVSSRSLSVLPRVPCAAQGSSPDGSKASTFAQSCTSSPARPSGRGPGTSRGSSRGSSRGRRVPWSSRRRRAQPRIDLGRRAGRARTGRPCRCPGCPAAR